MSAPRTLFAQRLVTCDERRATAQDPLGVIEDAFVRVEGGVVRAIGRRTELGAADAAEGTSVPLITPGLVDAHTHAAYAGSRHDEYALRMAGADYEAIAKAGGGIVSSMRAVRAAREDELTAELAARAQRMARMGVTTIEVKSGYGLDLENERKQLRAVRAAASVGPRLVPTYLGLHAVPPGYEGGRPAFARRVAEVDFAALHAEGLFEFVDAYVERSAFSVEETRPLLERARAAGVGVRLHVGQFADVGGAELAAAFAAKSVDHCEVLSERGAEALARAGVRAVLLPVASFTLGQAPPDVAMLRKHGVGLVVASDANPGTAPTESLPLALAFAVRSYGLSVAEALLGATREAARSLGKDDLGVVRVGAPADLALWDLPHEAALVQPQGVSRTREVLVAGRAI